MSVFEELTADMTARLQEAGITALPAWEREKLPEIREVTAVLGVRQSQSSGAAFWNYLGQAWDETAGGPVERYGTQMELTLYADLYAPRGQAEQIDAAFEKMETLVFASAGGGLRLHTLRRGETEADRVSGYLKCRCTMEGTAFITAARREEGALLTDFTLKGVVQ